MFFIFGWGHGTKKIIKTKIDHNCQNCNNNVKLVAYKITKWFTLFFIPIIPYNNKHYLVCPICNHGTVINDESFSKLRRNEHIVFPLIENKELTKPSTIYCPYCKASIDKNIATCPSCNHKINDVFKVTEYSCTECGKDVPENSLYCWNCGTALNEVPDKT